jgi:DNA-directed RNA polymerase subunit RPC12/RpoP
MYRCMSCGKIIEMDLRTAKKVICPACGYRILLKERPTVPKKVIAR